MTATHPLPRKLWEHPDPKSTQMWDFKVKLEQEKGIVLQVRSSNYSTRQGSKN